MVRQISLSEVSKQTPAILERGDSNLLDEGAAPTLNDLAGSLQFALGDGRIWLNDQRMVLMQTEALSRLRAGMIQEMGMDITREICMRVGWQEGVKNAELIAERFKQSNMTATLAAGPRVHTMGGFAKVETKRFEFDAPQQRYLGEFHWIDSAEGTGHVEHFGICDCPVCWMQIAVPSGYTSSLLGFPVIFREIECVAQGAQRCVIIGKDAASWGDDLPELATFGITEKPSRKPQPSAFFKQDTTQNLDTSDLGIIGRSAVIQRARRRIERAAAFTGAVMFVGEAGTGKEHFTRYLHEIGQTPKGPFVPVYCSAYSGACEAEVESLLGPDGLIASARGGTLFLNDVTTLPLSLQAKLVQRLRNEGDRHFRLISATNEKPKAALEAGRLRSDLHYMLSLLPIETPPLRDRRDDLPALIDHFYKCHTKGLGKRLDGLTGPLFDMLLRYDFPGNIRELSNMIERGVVYAEPGGKIDISHVFTDIEASPQVANRIQFHDTSASQSGNAAASSLDKMEIQAVVQALDSCDWNISEAARKLDLPRWKLDYRIKKYGLK